MCKIKEGKKIGSEYKKLMEEINQNTSINMLFNDIDVLFDQGSFNEKIKLRKVRLTKKAIDIVKEKPVRLEWLKIEVYKENK